MTTILIVDVEDLLRKGVREILEFSNFQVIQALEEVNKLLAFN
jgi:DNA-binding NarL/FixJ family response regulator